MLRPRIVPTLLLKDAGLYKTVKFAKPRYVGDPINTLRLFNDKAADELIILDIGSKPNRPDFQLLAELVSEAFMPICYGGGVRTLKDFERIFRLGVEKVAVNSAATGDMTLVSDAARIFGTQSIVVGLDVRRGMFGGYYRYVDAAARRAEGSVAHHALIAEKAGAGELLVYDVDRDGTMRGFDTSLYREVSDAVNIPVVACGGASSLADMKAVLRDGNASAAAAGSIFVFHGRHQAVLVTYPSPSDIDDGPGSLI